MSFIKHVGSKKKKKVKTFYKVNFVSCDEFETTLFATVNAETYNTLYYMSLVNDSVYNTWTFKWHNDVSHRSVFSMKLASNLYCVLVSSFLFRIFIKLLCTNSSARTSLYFLSGHNCKYLKRTNDLHKHFTDSDFIMWSKCLRLYSKK